MADAVKTIDEYNPVVSSGLTDNLICTQNGTTKRQSLEQLKELIRITILPPGIVFPVPWNADPATLGFKGLLLHGQGLLRSNYSDLDQWVYVGDISNATASEFYHADDASGTIRNTAGIYLIIPDARGQVVRGLDLTGLIDPDGASRDLGSLQNDALQGFGIPYRSSFSGAGGDESTQGVSGISGVIPPQSDGTNGTLRISSESRMKNIALNYVITY